MFSRILLLLILVFSFSDLVMGQNDLLNNELSIPKGSYTQKALIQYLEKGSGFAFSYSDNALFGENIPIEHDLNTTVKVVLDSIFYPLGYGYKELGEQLVIYKFTSADAWVIISGFVLEGQSNEVLIGATLYVDDLKVGTATNPYGFYSLKLPRGSHTIEIKCMGYQSFKKKIFLWNSLVQSFWLMPESYRVQEILVSSDVRGRNSESSFSNISKIDIENLKQMPGLFGEKDALRNLSLLPGVQSNEMSTGSIYVRGGSTDQTVFLMDEATLYNASHFGGLFSVFNPDVVNSVSLYKSNVPVSEGGALSSLIDVRLRDGHSEQWKVKGSLGIISARASVEGPLVKDKVSMLFAVRRSYVDQLFHYFVNDPLTKQLRFYFYDANFKINYKINKKNRLYLSGYVGYDQFQQFDRIWQTTGLATLRWNHLFNQSLFCNTSAIFSRVNMNQTIASSKSQIVWQSDNTNLRLKTDFTHLQAKWAKSKFGLSTMFYHILPNTYINEFDGFVADDYIAHKDQQIQNSAYYSQHFFFNKGFKADLGVRVTQMITAPFDEFNPAYIKWYIEPHLYMSYELGNNFTVKGNISRPVQPMHQLPLSTMGISINRLMPANINFKPQTSDNYSLGLLKDFNLTVQSSVEGYYRKMNNLIETLQDMRILTVDIPDNYLHHAKGEAYGIEFFTTVNLKKFTGFVTLDFAKVNWFTDGINNNKSYPASYVRKFNYILSGSYDFTERLSASMSWQWGSGLPYTAATGKYEVDNKTYLKFDRDKINTKQMPAYHRLDFSVDLAGKHNKTKRWKSFWNLSVYNVYFRKNALGVYYYTPVTDDAGSVVNASLSPSYFYLYQFVPSISYRFEF